MKVFNLRSRVCLTAWSAILGLVMHVANRIVYNQICPGWQNFTANDGSRVEVFPTPCYINIPFHFNPQVDLTGELWLKYFGNWLIWSLFFLIVLGVIRHFGNKKYESINLQSKTSLVAWSVVLGFVTWFLSDAFSEVKDNYGVISLSHGLPFRMYSYEDLGFPYVIPKQLVYNFAFWLALSFITLIVIRYFRRKRSVV